MSLGCICRNERGSVLVTGMVMLLLLTLMGVAAMQGANLQERMAGNLEQYDLAFQAAEAGLRDAEAWLSGIDPLPDFDGTGGCYVPANPDAPPQWKIEGRWDDGDGARSCQGEGFAEDPPRYIVEYMATIDTGGNDDVSFPGEKEDGLGMYRITSRGAGPNGRSFVFLQTTFVR